MGGLGEVGGLIVMGDFIFWICGFSVGGGCWCIVVVGCVGFVFELGGCGF